jgi:hypothetical protein
MSRRPSPEPALSPRDVEYSIASRDELWLRGRCVERLLSHGVARHRGHRIEASDRADPELVRMSGEQLEALRSTASGIADGRVRAVATARRIGSAIITETTMTITMRHVSIVTSAEFAPRDAAALRQLVATEARMEYRNLPIVWKNGSAAVLLHEAVGHAAEHNAGGVEWPWWLRVSDEPTYLVDDCGNTARCTDLLSESPASLRRESFRDVPLRRMSTVVVRQQQAPFELADERIEVHLVAGGNYDALTDTVTVNVEIAELVTGGASRRIRPFAMRRSRRAVAESLAGATGEPVRYPGVICSREGQEIMVGSYAPVMVTT